MAAGSCFAAIDAVGGSAKGQCAHGGDCFFTGCAVRHHARHGLDVGPPAAVFLLADDDWN